MKKALFILLCLLAMTAAGTGLKGQEVTIVLNPGWTWISYPSTDTVDFATALGSFTPEVGDVIKSRWGVSTYRSNGQWMGTVSKFYPGYGYHYKSNRQTPVILTFNVQQPTSQVMVTTSEPMLVTAITAMGGGEVTVSDGTYIIVKGLCWASHENPTINDDFYEEAGNGVGSFSIAMTELNMGTTYYVRAYAVTPNGTVYGDQKTFTTRDGIPTLTTADVTSITEVSATCGGNITDNGGLDITARGICWSTSPNPTLADTFTSDGSGIGLFISDITGLNANTIYYVRAYATNSYITAYGNEVIFNTMEVLSVDTITVMQYNLLEYGNYNSGFADCYETNNNTQHKDECIRTILNYVRPDILTVNEFGATQELLTSFLNNNLNINEVDYWRSDNTINYAGSNIVNHIFYDSRKMELKRHIALRTSPRDTDIYELYLKTPNLAFGDTIRLVCIVAHPKAGQGYQANRRALMQTAMDYVSQHYLTDNVLIMGDFNMYGASESGYQLLTQTYSNPDARFVDPVATIGGVGEWNNNSQFAAFHTQSTRGYSEECFSGGGMDDRFDFILMSDEMDSGNNNLRYVQNSYKAIGNDGNHFNKSIDQNGNTSVPADVLDALYDGSDHLPVTMKIIIGDNLEK